MKRKFVAGAKHIQGLLKGLPIPSKTEMVALFGFGSDKCHKTVGGADVVIAKDYILRILRELKGISPSSNAVPEKYPILRVLQMITSHRKEVSKALAE